MLKNIKHIILFASLIVMGSLSPKTRNSQVELYQSGDVSILGNKELIKYVILDGKEVDLTPAPKRIKDPAGWRISSYSGKILKKNKT